MFGKTLLYKWRVVANSSVIIRMLPTLPIYRHKSVYRPTRCMYIVYVFDMATDQGRILEQAGSNIENWL